MWQPNPAAGVGGRPSGLIEGLIEVGDDVVDALDADRKPHHVRPGTGLGLLLVGELAVRGGRRVDDEAPRIADIGEMREHVHGIDHLEARFVAALDAEGEDRAGAARQILLGKRVIGVRFEPGIGGPRDLGWSSR